MERPHRAAWGDGVCLLALVVLAFALRYFYVTTAVVEHPVRADAAQYVQYAINLIEHGTFSAAAVPAPAPDAYRSPGYPAFLAAIIALSSQAGEWYGLVLRSQAALGALTVGLLFLSARTLGLSTGWAVAAGAVLALWPHTVTMSGYLLTETLFGTLLMLASLLMVIGLKKQTKVFLGFAGATLGATTLVNPVAVPIAVLAALVSWRRVGLRSSVFILAIALFPMAAWSIRNQQVVDDDAATSSDRIGQNFIQGSWPLYHQAYHAAIAGDLTGKQILRDIHAEEQSIAENPVLAVLQISQRMGEDPGYYARWYLWDKPILFWGWRIRMGQGDIYVYPTRHSPFSSEPWLAAVASAAYGLNPLLGVLMLGYILCSIPKAISSANWPSAGHLFIAATLLGMTLLHVLLQAEPRLSIPFRPLQFLAATAAAAWLVALTRSRVRRSKGSSA